MKEIEPTAEDWARVEEFLDEDPRRHLLERLARSEARRRVERERLERRRRRLNRLTLGLLGR